MKSDMLQKARQAAGEILSKERFFHTECVAREAKALAECYGEDVCAAEAAGYLHDIAKEMSRGDLLQMLGRSAIIDVDEIRNCPPVWHAYAGGVYAREMLSARDDIVSAISSHTTGSADMSNLQKIIFLADYISEDRDFDFLDDIRALAYKSLDEAVVSVIERQILFLMNRRSYVDINMIRAYNDLVLKGENQTV